MQERLIFLVMITRQLPFVTLHLIGFLCVFIKFCISDGFAWLFDLLIFEFWLPACGGCVQAQAEQKGRSWNQTLKETVTLVGDLWTSGQGDWSIRD